MCSVVSSLHYLDVTLGGSGAWPAARLHHRFSSRHLRTREGNPGAQHLPPWGKHSCNNNDLTSTLSTAPRGEHSESHKDLGREVQ